MYFTHSRPFEPWTSACYGTFAVVAVPVLDLITLLYCLIIHIYFIDIALRMSVLREAELPPNQPDAVELV